MTQWRASRFQHLKWQKYSFISQIDPPRWKGSTPLGLLLLPNNLTQHSSQCAQLHPEKEQHWATMSLFKLKSTRCGNRTSSVWFPAGARRSHSNNNHSSPSGGPQDVSAGARPQSARPFVLSQANTFQGDRASVTRRVREGHTRCPCSLWTQVGAV